MVSNPESTSPESSSRKRKRADTHNDDSSTGSNNPSSSRTEGQIKAANGNLTSYLPQHDTHVLSTLTARPRRMPTYEDVQRSSRGMIAEFYRLGLVARMPQNLAKAQAAPLPLIGSLTADQVDKIARWSPARNQIYHAQIYREDLTLIPESMLQSVIIPEWDKLKVTASPSVWTLLRGPFSLLPMARNGNSYWNSMSAHLYGDPMYGIWVKAQHLAFFEDVLADTAHTRHTLYLSLARTVVIVPVLDGQNLVRTAMTLRQILHTPNAFATADFCQITSDLYDVQVVHVVETADQIQAQTTGPKNSEQKFIYQDVRFNHFDVLYPDSSAYKLAWEFRIELPDILTSKSSNSAFGDSRQPFPSNGQKFRDIVWPPLIPRTVIPEPTNDHLSIVLGVEVLDRLQHRRSIAQGPPTPDRVATAQHSTTRENSVANPAVSQSTERAFTVALTRTLETIGLPQLRSMGSKLKAKLRPKSTKKDAVRIITAFILKSDNIPQCLTTIGVELDLGASEPTSTTPQATGNRRNR